MVKRQVVLDEDSNTLLDELAAARGNNRSFVVREAIRVYAAMETYLDDLEQDPRFRKMMQDSEADISAGRLRPHRRAEQIVRRKRR